MWSVSLFYITVNIRKRIVCGLAIYQKLVYGRQSRPEIWQIRKMDPSIKSIPARKTKTRRLHFVTARAAVPRSLSHQNGPAGKNRTQPAKTVNYVKQMENAVRQACICFSSWQWRCPGCVFICQIYVFFSDVPLCFTCYYCYHKLRCAAGVWLLGRHMFVRPGFSNLFVPAPTKNKELGSLAFGSNKQDHLTWNKEMRPLVTFVATRPKSQLIIYYAIYKNLNIYS